MTVAKITETVAPPRSVVAGSVFGTRPLPRPLEALRRCAARFGRGRLARLGVSLVRRVLYLWDDGPFDVEVFPGRWARLHPRDNLSEKRAFVGPQFFDAAERAAIAGAIRRAGGTGDHPFVFVDAGANAGLYSLWALSVAGTGAVRVIAVEPEPAMAERLRANLAGTDARVVEAALSDAAGRLRLSGAGANRGEVRLDATGETEVEAVTLADVLRTEGIDRLDALKIDIEGAEGAVLAAFFRDAAPALWPSLVVIEAPRGSDTAALACLREHGYRLRERTRLNAVLVAPARDDGRADAGGAGGMEDWDGQA